MQIEPEQNTAQRPPTAHLGDFTLTPRILLVVACALPIGAVAAGVALHWMWWPAIGGVVIGIGGLIEPRALGVGYDVIGDLLSGRAAVSLIVGIPVVKSLIWGLSLGSGTSGGVLAPTFMIGAALGALEGLVFPSVGPGFWALIGLAAVVGGVMRSPLTGIIFALELTHAWSALLPLLVVSSTAYGVSALLLRRSVLTEKVARRGYHLSREYDVDPLEVLFVSEVMHTGPAVVAASDPLPAPAALLAGTVPRFSGRSMPFRDPLQRLYPALDESGTLVGVVPQQSILDAGAEVTQMRALLVPDPLVVYEHDTLRAVAGLFADHAVTAAPVVDAAEPGRLLGIVTVQQLLDGRLRDLAEERHRERLIIIPRWRWRWGGVRAGRNGSGPAGEVPVAGATDGTTGTASGLPADIPSGIPSDIPSDIPPAGRGDDHSDDRSA